MHVKKEITEIIRTCLACQKKKTLATKPLITPIISKYPRDRYIVDLVDLSAYKHLNNNFSLILIVVDSFSKFGFARSILNKQGSTVTREFENIFQSHGAPGILHTDNGKEFQNSD